MFLRINMHMPRIFVRNAEYIRVVITLIAVNTEVNDNGICFQNINQCNDGL